MDFCHHRISVVTFDVTVLYVYYILLTWVVVESIYTVFKNKNKKFYISNNLIANRIK